MVANITYYTVPGLAREIEAQLSEAEIKQLIRRLAKNVTAEFHENRDSVAMGRYAPITAKTCPVCGRSL